MKKNFAIIGILVLLAYLLGAFTVPCTPPSSRALCRKEIGRMIEYLSDGNFYGISFSMRDPSICTNGIAFCIGDFCDRVNQVVERRRGAGKSVFRVAQSRNGEGKVVLDMWGTPYNFCSIGDRQSNRWDALASACEFRNIVIWSSGPNKINEYGLNDDVVLSRSRFQKCLMDEKDAKEP